MKTRTFLFLILTLSVLPSCKKMLVIEAPYTSINAANVFTNNETATAVLTSIYTNISLRNGTQFSTGTNELTGLSLFCGLSADELTLYDRNNTKYSIYYKNDLNSTNTSTSTDYWKTLYPIIFTTNSALEGIAKSQGITIDIKRQLIGEAKFIRGFCYFYLVNIYGSVPLILSTDWQVTSALNRVPQEEVYDQIVSDLSDAGSLLSEKYLRSDALTPYPESSAERVRPTKWAAAALLARAYLYKKDWQNAEKQATLLIENNKLFNLLPDLNSVFKKNSMEAIWQLQPVGTGTNSNTGDGKLFILPSAGPSSVNPVHLSASLIGTFENGDLRWKNWTGTVTPSSPGTVTYFYPLKYKIGATNTTTQEYIMVLRLAEQYLIRGESRVRLGNILGAKSDLDFIRNRAGLKNSTSSSSVSLITEILHEKQVELFTEWGHRWFDLKRSETVDDIMNTATTIKGGIWRDYKKLFPIPLTELQRAPQLDQNFGY